MSTARITPEGKKKLAHDVLLAWLLDKFEHALNREMAEVIAGKAKEVYQFFGADEETE